VRERDDTLLHIYLLHIYIYYERDEAGPRSKRCVYQRGRERGRERERGRREGEREFIRRVRCVYDTYDG